MSCSNFLILVSSFLVILAAARILMRETRLGSCTNVSRNARFCMRKPPGPKGFFLQEKTPEAVAAKRKEKEAAWHWLSNTCHCSMKSMFILQSQARLKLSRMTRFRAATDRHVERLESSGNGSWNHFLELLFAFCHFQVSTKYSWWKRVLRFFRAKRKRKQGAPCPPHTRGGEVTQVCRKKYFSRIDGLEGLPFNPSIRMLL